MGKTFRRAIKTRRNSDNELHTPSKRHQLEELEKSQKINYDEHPEDDLDEGGSRWIDDSFGI